MKWETISQLHGKKFRRYTGIYRSVFERMLTCVIRTKEAQRKHPTKGVSSSLSIEDQLLMTVMFWREYRDQEHLAIDWGISQSTVSRTIRAIEDILIKSGEFTVPGHKSLLSKDGHFEVVIVDVCESPTERPKKNKSANTVVKRNATL
jgi:hypothetical protein